MNAWYQKTLYGVHLVLIVNAIKKSCLNNYHLLVSNITSELETTLNNSIVKAISVNITRDLQDTPPNILNSEEYVVRALELFKDKDNIKVSYLNKKEIEQLGMGLLLAVNAGSNKEARFIIIEYLGNPSSKEKLGLVGKGITFDSGGYSLKSSDFMINMKFDMSGAAVVTGVMYGLSCLKPNINVIAVAGLTDNRIGQNATLVESVVKSLSGKYVEIGDTDAEGRLVLADGISYLVEKANVDKVISVATLTGSCRRTLGE
ncbi:probable cytosol aminopeptidase [Stegodyphus dumicola]|uniref:probable cytosol aminopeptidase n=2 Tax=Stegodyphus dumicola TaxID=202533 RepID=UPI0015A97FDD|nr:probable cytosol aminopeptidase [Stegodyphus dumicola]